MKCATARDILNEIERLAPPELAEGYDNVGLLAGRMDMRVDTVLAALDITGRVIDEAKELGAQLILTHHPIMFLGRKNLREDDPEGALLCALVRAGLGLIAAHTNYDNAETGVSDALAAALGLVDVAPLDSGLRVGTLRQSLPPIDFCDYVQYALGGTSRLHRAGGQGEISRVAVCGGAGGGFYDVALAAGADAYVTGEIRLHEAIYSVESGMSVVEAGHYETEIGGLRALASCLQNALDELQYKVRVLVSANAPF